MKQKYGVIAGRTHKFRLAAPAERWGGFGTCAQSGQRGDRRTQAVPGSLQAQRQSAQTGPGPTCGKRTTRNGGLELAKRATDPRVVLPPRGPLGAESTPLGAHESTKERRTSSTRTGTLLKPPGSQSNAAAARHHRAGGGRREFRDCVGIPRACSRTRTTRRGNHLSRNRPTRRPRLIDSGWRLPPFVGCFRSTP